jgi:glycopeptide antibiotics resistance protein
MRNYFGDFLALIVCVPLFINIEIMVGVRKSEKIKLSEIIFFFCVFSVLYEVICPYLLQRMTSDIFDVLFYALGGVILYFSQNIFKYNRKEN